MSLPKRNSVIRIFYGLAILGMFCFLIWQSLPYNTDGRSLATGESEINMQGQLQDSKIPSVQAHSVHRETAKIISGMSRELRLDNTINEQIEQFWIEFSYSSLAKKLPNNQYQIYAVYSNYNNLAQTVTMTLGFSAAVGSSSEVTVSVAAGQYLKLPDKTVLQVWKNTGSYPQQFLYQADYELWKLGGDFKPSAVTAHIKMK